jgi:hypothetical protein
MTVLLAAVIFDLLNASLGVIGFTIGYFLARLGRPRRRRREGKLRDGQSDCFIV